MILCPACGQHIEGVLTDIQELCPHCAAPLVPEHLRNRETAQPEILDTAAMKPFELVDPLLYERIHQVVPRQSWQIAVMAEIIEYQFNRLSQFLNNAGQISHNFMSFGNSKQRIEKLHEMFDDFISALADIQEVFANDMLRASESSDMQLMWEFHDHLNLGVERILTFYKKTVSMRFVRESRFHQVQSVMLDWVQNLLICFERVAKQMRRKSSLEPGRLRDLFVQVALAPPTLPRFFMLMDELEGKNT